MLFTLSFCIFLMVPLKYADVSKFCDVTDIFSMHKYKVLVLNYTHAKFQDSIISNQKVSGVGQYDPPPWGIGV